MMKKLSPNLIDLSRNPPATIGPIKLDSSNKMMNEAFAEISLVPLKRSESSAKDIVYIKYTKPEPRKVNVSAIRADFKKNGINAHENIPRVVTKYAVRRLPNFSESITNGYCINTVPIPPTMGKR